MQDWKFSTEVIFVIFLFYKNNLRDINLNTLRIMIKGFWKTPVLSDTRISDGLSLNISERSPTGLENSFTWKAYKLERSIKFY